jgi:HPt (histidine-containing phosphotransfer) domain-containing protein
MLLAYGNYLGALCKPSSPRDRRDMRSAARTQRSNAQASLDRMGSEPGTPGHLMELAQTLHANGNRLARTAMTLEALIDENKRHPHWDAIGEYTGQAQAVLQDMAQALREERDPAPLPDLRGQQRALAQLLAGSEAEDRQIDESIVQVTDRLADNIDTIHHILARKTA